MTPSYRYSFLHLLSTGSEGHEVLQTGRIHIALHGNALRIVNSNISAIIVNVVG